MSMHAKLGKIEAAVQELQRRAGLRPENLMSNASANPTVSEGEAAAILDILFGIAGAGVLAHTITYDETPEEQALIEMGFEQVEGRWEIGREAESALLQSWLAEADQVGRTVWHRDLIERWVTSNVN